MELTRGLNDIYTTLMECLLDRDSKRLTSESSIASRGKLTHSKVGQIPSRLFFFLSLSVTRDTPCRCAFGLTEWAGWCYIRC